MDAFPVLHSFVLTAFTEVKLNAWNEIMNECVYCSLHIVSLNSVRWTSCCNSIQSHSISIKWNESGLIEGSPVTLRSLIIQFHSVFAERYEMDWFIELRFTLLRFGLFAFTARVVPFAEARAPSPLAVNFNFHTVHFIRVAFTSLNAFHLI